MKKDVAPAGDIRDNYDFHAVAGNRQVRIYENEKGENVMKSMRKSTFVVLSTILLTACGSVQLHGDYDSPQAAIEDFDANYAEAISEHQSYSDEMAGKTVSYCL